MDTQTIQYAFSGTEPLTKVCRGCHLEKPINNFCSNGRTPAGKRYRKSVCEHCRRARDKTYTRATRVRVRRYTAGDERGRKCRSIGAPEKCYLCGDSITFETAHLDHVIPRSKGGTKAKSNLKWACVPCNQVKGNLRIPELLERLGKILTHLTSP